MEAVKKGLDNQKYYAALVIPKDFSAKQASLRTPAPSSPEVQIFINQGMNTAASTMAGQILNGVVDNMNNNVRTTIDLMDLKSKEHFNGETGYNLSCSYCKESYKCK